MITLNQSLVSLVGQGLISEAVALSASYDPSEFTQLLSKDKKNIF